MRWAFSRENVNWMMEAKKHVYEFEVTLEKRAVLVFQNSFKPKKWLNMRIKWENEYMLFYIQCDDFTLSTDRHLTCRRVIITKPPPTLSLPKSRFLAFLMYFFSARGLWTKMTMIFFWQFEYKKLEWYNELLNTPKKSSCHGCHTITLFKKIILKFAFSVFSTQKALVAFSKNKLHCWGYPPLFSLFSLTTFFLMRSVLYGQKVYKVLEKFFLFFSDICIHNGHSHHFPVYYILKLHFK